MSNFTSPTTTDLSVLANEFLDALYPELVAVKRVRLGVPVPAQYGDEIQIADINITGAPATRIIGGAATASDLVTLTKSMTKTQIYYGFKLDNLEGFFSSLPLMQQGARDLARGVANQIDANILSNMAQQAVYEVGKTDGSAVWNSTDLLKPLNDSYKKFRQNGVSTRNLYAAFGATEAANFRSIPNLFKANEAGTDAMLRDAILGRIFAHEVIESENVLSTLTVSAAAATDSPASVTGVNAQGSSTLVLGGLGTGTVKKYTTFTIAGFTQKSGALQGFTVTADATITANAATVSIFPKLPAATAGSEVVTFAEHSAAGSPNVAWDRDSVLAYIEAPAPFPEGTGVLSVRVVDDESGVGVRIAMKSNVLGSAGSAYNTEISADVIFATMIRRPEGVVRIWGAV